MTEKSLVKLISFSGTFLRKLTLTNFSFTKITNCQFKHFRQFRSLCVKSVAGSSSCNSHCQNLFVRNLQCWCYLRSSCPQNKSFYKSSCINIQIREMASSNPVQQKLSKVPDVDIDSSGRFKYILIKVYTLNDPAGSPSKEQFKYVVRGYLDCPYHGDIYDRFVDTLKTIDGGGYDSECVGGGRITHGPKKIDVFGYSQGYGRADHSITVEVLKKNFPSDYTISWNNDGY